MKLTIASTAAALILTTAASAMTSPIVTDFRDVAAGALGQVTTGEQISVDIDDYVRGDGQARAQIGQDVVNVTVFESASSAQPLTDNR